MADSSNEKTAQKPTKWSAGQWMALPVSVFGGYVVLYSVAMVLAVLRTRDWPVVEGTVQDLQVFEDGNSAQFLVSYQYVVDETRHKNRWGEGSNHGRGNPGADSEYTTLHILIEEFESKYGKGKPIEVHYDPADPSDSFIESGENPLIAAAVTCGFGLLFASALPFSLRRKTDSRAGPKERREVEPENASESETANANADLECEEDVAKILTGSGIWAPGERVVFERPGGGKRFLIVSGLVLGAIAGLSIWMLIGNADNQLGPDGIAFGILSIVGIVFFATVAFLQAFWCDGNVVFDWPENRIVVTVAGKESVYSMDKVRRLVLRSSVGHSQLLVQLSGEEIVLFDSLDHGFTASIDLPTDQLPAVASQLAGALGVSVGQDSDQSEAFRGNWSYVPGATRVALVAVTSAAALRAFDFISLPVASVFLAGGVLFGVSAIVLADSPGGKEASQAEEAKVSHIGALAVLSIFFAIAYFLLDRYLPLTGEGLVICALGLTGFSFLCVCVPDLVMSQRAGVTIPMITILSLRLSGAPVQRLVLAFSILRGKYTRCSIATLQKIAADSRPTDADELVAATEKEFEAGRIELLPVPKSVPNRAEGPRTLGHHLVMLGGAFVGLIVIGFFFVVSGGPAHFDDLLIDRNWQETDATITRFIASQGRDHSPQYEFSFDVNQVTHRAICFGPKDLRDSGESQARYDVNQPHVAYLVGGWRADGLPFLSIFFLTISMLVILPLPVLLGHIIASLKIS